MPGIFLSNGYLVFKSSVNDMFLIFDPATGILRDVMYLNGTVSGAGCFSDLQTEWIYKDGIDILSNPGSATMMNINAIGDIALNFDRLQRENIVKNLEHSEIRSQLKKKRNKNCNNSRQLSRS